MPRPSLQRLVVRLLAASVIGSIPWSMTGGRERFGMIKGRVFCIGGPVGDPVAESGEGRRRSFHAVRGDGRVAQPG